MGGILLENIFIYNSSRLSDWNGCFKAASSNKRHPNEKTSHYLS